MEVSSQKLRAFKIWDLFEIKSVDIAYVNGDWNVTIRIEIFKHELAIKYENAECKVTEKVEIKFNEIVRCLLPELASIFDFKLILEVFQCDFGNQLQILMKSPETGGEWIMMRDSNNEKMLYLNKMKF